MSSIGDAWTLWSWPLQVAQLGYDLAETMLGAREVVGARLPMIAAAARDPATADHAELRRMVSEKVAAFGRSGRSLDAAGKTVRNASAANARALGRMAGGDPIWPWDWLRLAEGNLAAAAALATLPADLLRPLHAGVTANVRRLGSA